MRRRVGLVATALSASLLLLSCGDDDGLGPEIPEPEILSSRNGVLQVTLTQAPARVTVAGRSFTSNVFNGQYIPPVLKMQRGDRLELQLVNRIDKADIQIDGPQSTNLHYHGMVVPPVAPGDDVFLDVGAGADYDYRWQVPSDHAQGTHWYHPHSHGLVEPQILSGMSGMLVIDGAVAQHYTAFSGLVERHLLLKDIVLPGADPDAANTKTINGLLGGTLRLRPGEMQVWNLGNLGADAYFDLAIDGVQLWEINRDGNVLIQPKLLSSVYLPPGSRSTVVVVAPLSIGQYPVRTLEVDTGPQGDPNPNVQAGPGGGVGHAAEHRGPAGAAAGAGRQPGHASAPRRRRWRHCRSPTAASSRFPRARTATPSTWPSTAAAPGSTTRRATTSPSRSAPWRNGRCATSAASAMCSTSTSSISW